MEASKWVTGHGIGQFQLFAGALPGLTGKTLRADIRNGISGGSFRVVLGEQYGAARVLYKRAVVELRGTQTQLTFGGAGELVVESGKQIASDPVLQPIAAGDTVTLWLYNGGGVSESGCLVFAAHSSDGDFCGQNFSPEPFRSPLGDQGIPEMFSGYCRLEVETRDAPETRIVAAFGDSIAAMGIWTGPLGERIAAASPRACLLNYGISGNRLLRDTSFPIMGNTQFFGRAGLSRFQWDILQSPGIGILLLALGVNDISQPGGEPGRSPDIGELCSAEELIEGFRRFIRLCRDNGIRVAGSSMTPFGGYQTYNDKTAGIWREVNRWIIDGGEFDLTLDFAAVIADPDNGDYMAAKYDSGDHLHPNPAGGAAMAAAVDLGGLLA